MVVKFGGVVRRDMLRGEKIFFVEVRLYRAVFMHFPNGARTSGFGPKGEILSRRSHFRGSPMFSERSRTSHDFRNPFPPVSGLILGFRNIFRI